MISFKFSTYVCDCSVKTELIGKKQLCEKWSQSFPGRVQSENRQFSMSFAFELTSGQWSCCTENWTSAFCEFQQHLFRDVIPKLFLKKYQFFSEPGQIHDHCPIPNFFANMETTLAFATHSSSLSSLSQEMSLNIDTNRILPVKVCGASPKSLSRSLIFITELQRCESWENVPLEFSRLSIDTVKVSVALRSCDPSYSLFPCFIRFRVLVDLSKAQHRI